jgi:hypothetical protein
MHLSLVLGGAACDYHPILGDTWLAAQPEDVRREMERLISSQEATQEGQRQRLATITTFARRSIVGAALVITGTLGFLAWRVHLNRELRKDAYRYACRVYGDRDAAIGLVGQEIARGMQAKALGLAEVVEASIKDPAERARVQKFCLDLSRYYRAIEAQYKVRTRMAEHLAKAPEASKDRNLILDTITGQPIDVERYDGGRLDLEAIRRSVSQDLQIQQSLDLAGKISRGEIRLEDMPPLEEWGRIGRDTQ